MHNIDDVNSILNAINEINLKPKKKNIDLVNAQIKIPKLNQDFKISPDVKKLIEDAEAYKKKLSSSTLQLNLIHPKNFISKTKNYDKTLEDIQSEIIKNLYTKFSKKIKKNTLKIIFNLHLKIKDLENKLENFQTKKEHSSNAEISTVKIKVSNPSRNIAPIEALVTENQVINGGQTIGTMGSSATEEIKLIFEVRDGGKSIDPLKYLKKYY